MGRGVIMTILFLPVLTFCLNGQSSNLWAPFIKSFPKTVYGAGINNQDIIQDERGVLYFANNGGMLAFYGNKWKCYPLANKTVVRALALCPSGIIYAGGQNELGYFAPNQEGEWAYHSLRDSVPEEHRNFDDVWDIEITREGVFFRASGKIFQLQSGRFRVFSFDGPVSFLGTVGTDIFIQAIGQGILQYQDGSFVEMPATARLKNELVTAMLPFRDRQLLIASLKRGLFVWDGHALNRWEQSPNDFLSGNQVRCAALLPDSSIALGTTLNGLLIIDKQGRPTQHLSRQNGLLSNTVVDLLVDKNRHLWLALEGGINYLLTDSPFRSIFPDMGLEGIPFGVQIFGGRIYFATSNGIYYTDWNEGYGESGKINISLVENSQGQVWSLNAVGGELLAGHHDGDFTIQSGKASRLSTNRGFWLFDTLAGHPDHMIGGGYDGLHLYRKQEGQWRWVKKFSELQASSRFMAQDNRGYIWISHPYKGVYQAKLDDKLEKAEVRKMGMPEGLPSNVKNHVFKVGGEVLICAEQGVYYYDYPSGSFKAHSEYNRIFGTDVKVRRLFESPAGDVWYVTEQEVGVLEVQEKSLHKEVRKRDFPELRKKLIGGFEFIYPAGPRHVFFATEDGFILLDPSKPSEQHWPFSVLLDEVIITGNKDSLRFHGVFFENGKVAFHQPDSWKPELPHYMNALYFSFSAADFANPNQAQYRFFLQGFEEEWADWSLKNNKEYSNLSPGKYTFKVQAKNINGLESAPASYQFVIRPPWYASPAAYWAYGLFAFTLLLLAFWLPQRKYLREKNRLHSEQKRLISEHQRAIEQSEQEKMKLKNEKLLIEIEHKNRELVSTALNVVEKKDILSNMAQELSRIHKNCPDPDTKRKIGHILNKFDHEKQFDEDWKQFMYHFEQVHEDFFQRLHQKHPELTARDHKLCAYLRLNLSTKEIASILNITVRSAEVSRYRLRKKLGLESDDSLNDYLMSF